MTMSAETIEAAAAAVEVLPVEPTIGAEIRGVDLGRDLDDADVRAIEAALLKHRVIFFRDQPIAPERLAALGRRFGELTVHPFQPHFEHMPEVMIFDNHKDNPVLATDIWHSDETFREEPPMGTILQCMRIPETGGDTVWADMCAAYAGLSAPMQAFLEGLEAVHDFVPFRRKFAHLPPREKHERLAAFEEELPNPTHPVVRTHPVTGEKALFVNAQFTLAIKGLRPAESKALLDFLVELPRVPEYQFRMRWQPGTIVFWDNRSTQHYAANDYYPSRRTMHRVTVKGDRPR